MTKTKRTVEDANVVATTSGEVNSAAAAGNDSKLITQGKLKLFANKLWKKIKDKYDRTFNEVSLSDRTSQDKKLTFTRVNGTREEINLEDYVRIQDKNDFKQDVSSNVGMTDETLKLGTINGTHNHGRVSGHRSITTKQFVDNYVSYLSVLTDDSLTPGSSSSWTVWAVEKKTNRTEDRVYRAYENNNVTVKEKNIGNESYKYVDLTVNDTFENKEIYFIVGCNDLSKGYRVIRLKEEYKNENAVNVRTRPTVGGAISWEDANDNIAVMVIHGRESIGSLSEKINKLSPDSGLYVKQEETTNTGGTASANKVVRLGNNGKLDKDMLPSIAINDYFEIEQFTNDALRVKEYENGDVAVVRNTGKKYLCINKVEGQSNLTDAFIELNSKDGSVVSVNEKTGAVNLELEATADKLKLKIKSGSDTTNIAETSVLIVTDDDINDIINGLTN